MTTPQEIINEFRKEFQDVTHINCVTKTIPCGTMKNDLESFLISTVIKQYEEMLEEVEKEINEDYPSGVDEDTVGQWECGYYKRLCDNRLSLQSKIKEWKLIDNK